LGGAIAAIGFVTREIDESAWGYQERYRTGQDVVVGLNRFVEEDDDIPHDILRVDPTASAGRSLA